MTPRIRSDASLAGALLAEEFVEFGSSGNAYDKREVLAAIANEVSTPPEIAEFTVKSICRRLDIPLP